MRRAELAGKRGQFPAKVAKQTEPVSICRKILCPVIALIDTLNAARTKRGRITDSRRVRLCSHQYVGVRARTRPIFCKFRLKRR
jgi:hypothetical protein